MGAAWHNPFSSRLHSLPSGVPVHQADGTEVSELFSATCEPYQTIAEKSLLPSPGCLAHRPFANSPSSPPATFVPQGLQVGML